MVENEKVDLMSYSSSDELMIPDHKAVIVRVEGDNVTTSAAVNEVIRIEYQCGWTVQDIVYVGHLRSVLILFKVDRGN